MIKELTFRPQARIIRTLGDRLISSEVAAITELVKNAFDADAKICSIEINPKQDTLIIMDDGCGMSLKDVQTKWAELGTDNKLRNNVSRSGRSVLGNKGIGRLAAAKLGRYLKIESTVEKNGGFITTNIYGLDWDAFLAKGDTYIEDIKFYAEEVKVGEKTGTKLIISGLNKVWNKEKLKALVVELRKLISPISKDDSDFHIYLNLDAFSRECDKFESGIKECGKSDSDIKKCDKLESGIKKCDKFDGSIIVNGTKREFLHTRDEKEVVRNRIEPFQFLDACDYTFEAEYSGNQLSGILKINDAKIEQKIEVTSKININLGEGLIQFNIFDRDADSVKNTFIMSGIYSKEDKKSFSLRDARRHLDNLSGIAIYRNRFKIRPYGDKDADWLGLNKRRVQNPSKHLEQAQISGLIVVDTEIKSGLIERSSREGFEHNDHFNAFKVLILEAINQIEINRYAHNLRIGKNRKDPKATIKSAFFSLREQADLTKIKSFSEEFSGDKEEKFNTAVTEYKTSLDKLIDIIQERQSILEVRATLGFILAEVIHEARHPTSTVGANLISLSKRVRHKWQSDISLPVADILFDKFLQNISHIQDLEDLFARLDPLINVRRKKIYNFSVFETVKKSLLLFKEKIFQHGICVEHNEPKENYLMHGLEVDLSSAMINLIDNTIYWHENRKINAPFIKISYKDGSDSLFILVEDNAGGISDKYQDAIFNVGFTTKTVGSGLGLSIAREALGRAGAYLSHDNTNEGSIFKIENRKDI